MVTPRPIAFISSQDKAGTVNVSPYSYFNVMSHDPIHITIGATGCHACLECRLHGGNSCRPPRCHCRLLLHLQVMRTPRPSEKTATKTRCKTSWTQGAQQLLRHHLQSLMLCAHECQNPIRSASHVGIHVRQRLCYMSPLTQSTVLWCKSAAHI